MPIYMSIEEGDAISEHLLLSGFIQRKDNHKFKLDYHLSDRAVYWAS
jgi:hypothetical protein